MGATLGTYLYNLQTGETIGIRKDRNAEGAERNGETVTCGYSQWSYDEYDLIGNHSIEGIEYGRVEDLSFDQLVDLFLAGNLTPHELSVGLESKGATYYSASHMEGGNYDVSFKYEGKQYSLSCATDAVRSQLDTNNVQGTMSVENVNNVQGTMSVENVNNVQGTMSVTNIDKNNPEVRIFKAELLKEAEVFALTYFGIKDVGKTLKDALTEKQLKFVYDNPQIFHLVPGDGYYIQIDNYLKEYAIWHLSEPSGYMPKPEYSYKEGEYDMLGNGCPPGPDGSIPYGDIPGVFVKADEMFEGKNHAIFYMWNEKNQEYEKSSYINLGHENAFSATLPQGLLARKNVMIRGGHNFHDELFYSLVSGYNQTSVDGVYEKDGKYYRRYSGSTNSWYEVSVDKVKIYNNACSLDGSNSQSENTRTIGEPPEGTTATNLPGVYYKMQSNGSCVIYMWDDSHQRYDRAITTPVSISQLEEAFKTGDLSLINTKRYVEINGYFNIDGGNSGDTNRIFAANFFGMNSTSTEDVYEKDGKYYKFDVAHGDMMTTPLEGRFSEFFEEVGKPEVIKSSEITVYKTNPPKTDKKLEGVSTTTVPSNITYDEFMQYVTMNNYLQTNIKEAINDFGSLCFVTPLQSLVEGADSKLCLLQGNLLTPENWQQFINAITYYDKDELSALVLEKLKNGSMNMFYEYNKDAIKYLISGIGGTNISVKEGDGSEGHVEGIFTIRPTYVEFTLNGDTYSLPFIPRFGYPVNKDCIATASELNELLQYISKEELKQIIDEKFVPLLTINGEVQNYMFNENIQAVAYTDHMTPFFNIYKTKAYTDPLTRFKFDVYITKNAYTESASTDSSIQAAAKNSVNSAPSINSDVFTSEDDAKTGVVQLETAANLEEDEPKEYMTADIYQQVSKNSSTDLQKKVGNVIYDNGIYYNVFNGKRYNYVYDPFEHKWLTYEQSQIIDGQVNNPANSTLVRIQMILAALMLGLTFTANPKICKDKDGNYYDFNQTT